MGAVFWVFIVPSDRAGSSVTIAGPAGHHLARVLRVRAGERGVAVSDGRQFVVEVSETRGDQVVGRIIDEQAIAAEPVVPLTLLQAVLPNPDFDAVIEGGTAVGIRRFIAVQAARSIGRPPANRAIRWQAIARSAAEQSHRGIIPEVEGPMSLASALQQAEQSRLLILDPAAATPLRPAAAATRMAIGPEGGWTDAEVNEMLEHGGITVSLGPRILRARLAPIVAAAILVQQS
jgi:16S rRNA (uracil1498-N3)-methyltransferase